jgi:predicted NAD/FAD-binding protein
MPSRRKAWSAWNYLTESSRSSKTDNSLQSNLESVSLTYNMNILQHIPVSEFSHVLVTMNPPVAPNPRLTQGKYSYSHPIYNAEAVRAQDALHEIQGKRGIWYAGAWTKYGFHEDGFTSGLDVALQLDGSVPWKSVDSKFSRGRRPILTWKDYLLRIWIISIQILLQGAIWLFAVVSDARKEKVP